MSVCIKCIAKIPHPFHDDGTENENDIQMWIDGEHAYIPRDNPGD